MARLTSSQRMILRHSYRNPRDAEYYKEKKDESGKVVSVKKRTLGYGRGKLTPLHEMNSFQAAGWGILNGITGGLFGAVYNTIIHHTAKSEKWQAGETPTQTSYHNHIQNMQNKAKTRDFTGFEGTPNSKFAGNYTGSHEHMMDIMQAHKIFSQMSAEDKSFVAKEHGELLNSFDSLAKKHGWASDIIGNKVKGTKGPKKPMSPKDKMNADEAIKIHDAKIKSGEFLSKVAPIKNSNINSNQKNFGKTIGSNDTNLPKISMQKGPLATKSGFPTTSAKSALLEKGIKGKSGSKKTSGPKGE